jgi:CheY-like chemotaxis protein
MAAADDGTSGRGKRRRRAVKNASYRILLVDDEDNDRLLLGSALRAALGDGSVIHESCDGEDAIAYFRGEDIYADRERFPFPNLLITDLHMPRVDGLALLEFLQSNPAWSVIPRVVCTSSCDDDDVKRAYLLGASAYHCKPGSTDELRELVVHLVHYWRHCELPPVDVNGRLLPTERSGKLGERYPEPRAGRSMVRP